MASPIERLPAELLDLITSCLPAPDYAALRLASRRLRFTSHAEFLKRFFTTVSTFLDPPSLVRLIDMSSHQAFANSVHNLHIKSRGGAPEKGPPIYEDFQFIRDVATSKNAVSIVRPLSRAMESLPNLKSVRFYLLGQNIEYTRSIYKSDIVMFQATCFQMILDAVIGSNTQLQELSTLSGDLCLSSSCAIIPHQAFNLALPYLVSLGNAFVTMKSMSLSINDWCSANSRVPGWENGISQFISTACLLEDLSLNLGKGYPVPRYSVPVMRSLAQTTRLHKLRSFQLYGGAFEESDLLDFMLSHKRSIRRISLPHVNNQDGSWKSVLVAFRDSLDLEYLDVQRPMEHGNLLSFCIDPPARTVTLMIDTTLKNESRPMGEILTEYINSVKRGLKN
jgi:hypothetical protein